MNSIWIPKYVRRKLWCLVGPAIPLNILLALVFESRGNRWIVICSCALAAFLLLYEIRSEQEDGVVVVVGDDTRINKGETFSTAEGHKVVAIKNRRLRGGATAIPIRIIKEPDSS